MLSICAVIAARNEAQYLRVLLPMLADQAIDVIIIDNESTDDSHELYSAFSGRSIIGLEHLPYRGYYSLPNILRAVRKVGAEIEHDWIIHQAPDEILEHFNVGLTLRDAIQQADESGYNILNFDEFVFLPESNSDYCNKNYYTEILRYYFFEPQKNRLNRAWKRALNIDNLRYAGHALDGDQISIYPVNHILRHYIVLSDEHAKYKYLNRVYSSEALSLGWHENKRNFTEARLTLPQSNRYLFQLGAYDSKEFRKDIPAPKHYWDWAPRK